LNAKEISGKVQKKIEKKKANTKGNKEERADKVHALPPHHPQLGKKKSKKR